MLLFAKTTMDHNCTECSGRADGDCVCANRQHAASDTIAEKIPTPIFQKISGTIPLSDVLNDVELTLFEKATTKYRKPSYQRFSCVDTQWEINFIESFLLGKAIGTFMTSRWSKMIQRHGECAYLDEWLNIEDGQTRMTALINYKEGKFTTKYGSYIKNKEFFEKQTIMILKLEKTTPRITDTEYHTALRDNFQLLNITSNALSDSDQYWSCFRSVEEDYSGSPLVNHTVDIVNSETFSSDFQSFMGFDRLDNRNADSRKKLASAISIIALAWKGLSHGQASYASQSSIINTAITDEELDNIKDSLTMLFEILKQVEHEKTRGSNEKFKSYFSTTQKFVGPILYDISLKTYTSEQLAHKWVTVINYCRSWYDGVTSCMKIEFYSELGDGKVRNSTSNDFVARIDAINKWYNAHILSQAE